MKDKIVVIKYPIWTYDLETAAQQYKGVLQCIRENGYDWDLIMIPRDCDWSEMTYEELKQVRDIINLVLEDKRNDIDDEARGRTEISS